MVVSCHDVEKGKPDPEGYLLAAERLGCTIENCVVFEDSVSGIETAVRSGARCIGIGNAQSICHNDADAFFPDFHHVIGVVDTMERQEPPSCMVPE